MDIRPGLRLSSQVCEAEFIVVRGSGDRAIECGGVSVVPLGDAKAHKGSVIQEYSGATLLGKRYVDAAETIEILCTKAGVGTISVDKISLSVKESKPLPSSD